MAISITHAGDCHSHLVLSRWSWPRRRAPHQTPKPGSDPADLLDYLLPRDIYTHVSARVDITLYVFERLLRPLWAMAQKVGSLILSVGTFAETQVIAGLHVVMGSGPALDTGYGWMLLYSLVTLLLYDFVFYVIHYTEHKVPSAL